MKIRTLNYKLRRVQPLSTIIHYLKALDREFDRLGERIDAENVVVVERSVQKPHTFEQSLLEVIQAARPAVTGIDTVDVHGRKVVLLFFSYMETKAIDITDHNHEMAVQKILKEALAA